ncbi:hypothetical protein HanHA300_Chr13g0465691 [Helianthus annuus]|nr:hypothetical protein HanHA300_Chr13g0465691 [Helianthus annuus]KAJ0662339.1 hypothetical protein HanLR1_Chr13g0468311 [Helianthus annuus]KAJ0669865.1 hypothetical protein HanOQP8_Chr13g0467411 [Helianthus annuus]
MEQTLIYTNKTKPMSRCLGENQEILIKDSSNAEKGSSFYSQEQNPSYDFIGRGSVPTLIIGNDEEYDIEDEESEFKMGRLIRQASLNSSHMSTPQQSIKVHIILKYYPSILLYCYKKKKVIWFIFKRLDGIWGYFLFSIMG